ncbi:MAG: HEPN domain-containing protein [Candidatus Bathyarchaeia archaeon]
MSTRTKKEKTIQDWLYASVLDLKCAKVLYDSSLFAAAIYHLQQSNEKLAKGLLIAMGFLSPKRAKTDLRIKEILGFLPKEPAAYRHRIMFSVLSDAEKAIPSIEEFLKLLESSELGPRLQKYHLLLRKSRKGVKKLKKRPFRPVENADQLKGEIRATEAILSALDGAIGKMTEEMAKLDFQELHQIAKGLVKAQGFNVEGVEPPDFNQIKVRVIDSFKLSVLIAMSVALASLLDPLEAMTRYPDSGNSRFDDSNPYVANFEGLYKVVNCIHEKSQELVLNKC